jgi:hypothetical protein
VKKAATASLDREVADPARVHLVSARVAAGVQAADAHDLITEVLVVRRPRSHALCSFRVELFPKSTARKAEGHDHMS